MAATLTLDRSSAHPGDHVVVSWAGIEEPTLSDWIGMFSTSAIELGTRVDNFVLQGLASGQVAFGVPTTLPYATYYFRLLANNSWAAPLATATLTVAPVGGGSSSGGSSSGSSGGETLGGSGSGGGTSGSGAAAGGSASGGASGPGFDWSALSRNPLVVGVVALVAAERLGLIGGGRR